MSFGRQNKYRAVRTNGFGSKLESAVHDVLVVREKVGEISDIRCQQSIVLQEGPSSMRIAVRIDFVAFDEKEQMDFAIEAKGKMMADFALKLKLWRADPPMKLEIWGGDYRRPKLMEVIETSPSVKLQGE